MKPQLKIPLVYFIFSILWVLLSDKAVVLLFKTLDLVTVAQTFKGWLFVIGTTAMLYMLLKRHFEQMAEKEREKREVFLASVRSSQHILNNFLNFMMGFHMDAEESNAVSPEALQQCEEVIFETKAKLTQLGSIADPDRKEIEKFLGR